LLGLVALGAVLGTWSPRGAVRAAREAVARHREASAEPSKA
jgi:hypothetical protein